MRSFFKDISLSAATAGFVAVLVGFTSSVVAGVWVGFDQPASISRSAYAARVALPIWVAFMRAATRQRRAAEFEPPPGLREVELCRMSYLRPVDW